MISECRHQAGSIRVIVVLFGKQLITCLDNCLCLLYVDLGVCVRDKRGGVEKRLDFIFFFELTASDVRYAWNDQAE